ncbi:MAG: hypothetical protein WCK67_03685 [bacterium]
MVNINRNLTFTNADLIKKQFQMKPSNQQAQPAPVVENSPQKANQELIADTLKLRNVEPDKPKGKTFNRGLLQWPQEIYETNVKGAKVLWKAMAKGEGNDKDIGSLNDLALGLGSLGIAAALALRPKASPAERAMEFAGFGTWFAAQAIWPKTILAGPVKFFTGVDINKTYQHSEGKINRTLTDPQYIPWDHYTQKEYDEVGKKCHIPENIKDRNKHVQNKIRQVGVQSNTLWMLTAGFSTPLISSLFADRLRPAVAGGLEMVNETKNSMKLFGFKKTLHDRIDRALQNLEHKMIPNATGNGLGSVGRGVQNFFISADNMLGTIKKPILSTVQHLVGYKPEEALKGFDSKAESISKKTAEQMEKLLESNPNKEKMTSELANMFKDSSELGSFRHTDLFNSIVKTVSSKMDEIPGKDATKQAELKKQIVSVVSSAKKFVEMAKDVEGYAKTTLGNYADTTIAHAWDQAPREMMDALRLPNAVRVKLQSVNGQTPNGISAVALEISDYIHKLPAAEREEVKIALDNVIHKHDSKLSGMAERVGVVFTEGGAKETENGVMQKLRAYSKDLSTQLYDSDDFKTANIYMDNLSNMVRDRIMNTKNSFHKMPVLFEAHTKEVELIAEYNKKNPTKAIDLKNGVTNIVMELSSKPKEALNDHEKTLLEGLTKSMKFKSTFDPHNLMTVDKGVSLDEFLNKCRAIYGSNPATEAKGTINEMLNQLFVSMYKIEDTGKDLSKWTEAALTDLLKGDNQLAKQLKSASGDDLKHMLEANDHQLEKTINSHLGELFNQAKSTMTEKGLISLTEDSIKAIFNETFNKAGIDVSHSLKTQAFIEEKADALAPKLKSAGAWLGKALDKFIADAAGETVLYRGWLTKVGSAFAVLTGVTLIASSMMGKKNKYNPGVYEVRETKKYE